jgi:inorganic pyrophosphatase
VLSAFSFAAGGRETTMKAIAALPTFNPESGELLSVVETPKGSRNKYAFNPALGLFELRRVMPRGMLFPYDFGFIPATRADDGDPLDVLLMLEDSAPQGCVIRVRAIGAIEARQRDAKGEWVRNDRLIAVAVHAKLHADLRSIKELNPRILDEIEAFFRDYNEIEGREFEPLKRAGPNAALTLIQEAQNKKKASEKKQAA